jgi:hypothetical protein
MKIQPEKNAAFVKALSGFLLSHIANSANPTKVQCLATIIAHVCSRPDYLWRDLGFAGRDEVTAMLSCYFPARVTRNFRQNSMEEMSGARTRAANWNGTAVRARMSPLRRLWLLF